MLEEYKVQLDCRDLTRKELDLVILGQIMAGVSAEQTKRGKDRTNTTVYFHHKGYNICGYTFRMLHGIGTHHMNTHMHNTKIWNTLLYS